MKIGDLIRLSFSSTDFGLIIDEDSLPGSVSNNNDIFRILWFNGTTSWELVKWLVLTQ